MIDAVLGSLLVACAASVPAGPLEGARSSAEIFTGESDDPYTLAVRAFVWGYPLVRAAEVRLNTTLPDKPDGERLPDVPGASINRIGHARALSTPRTRLGVAPNHDTVYSLAWLDLSEEPFVLESPDFGQRYYVFQMGQADTSTELSFGQRSHGGRLPPIFIYGPAFDGQVPKGMLGVSGLQRYLMIAGRILVDGPTDLGNVHALQDEIRLDAFSVYESGEHAPRAIPEQRALVNHSGPVHEELRFLQKLGAVLRDWAPGTPEISLIESFETIGLHRERGFRAEKLTQSQRKAIVDGFDDAHTLIRAKTFTLGQQHNGWSINYRGSRFGDDYLLRAAVAMDQIYVLPPEEALYASARVDGNGKILDGRNRYRITFAKADLPPVDAFWSITLYFAKGFMVPNPIDRWAIGDRTPALGHREDGSLEIYIQHDRPVPPLDSNWLPAPAEPFMLLMRMYNPRKQILDGTWLPPGIEKTNSSDRT